jgi:hypothetical protein
MRRMREFPWGLLVLAVPIGGAVYAVHHLAKQPGGAKPAAPTEVADASKGEKATEAKSRRPASAMRLAGGAESDAPAAVADHLLATADARGQCESVEFPGDGRQSGEVSTDRWSSLMKQFHGAKADLLAWLKRESRHFNEEQLAMMEGQVRAIRIQRPPHAEEPDLHWRGTVALTRDSLGEPLLRVGTGFLTLVEKQPARARFELARIVAQTWSPCELQRLHVGKPWAGLLGCLGLEAEAQGCTDGSLGDGGWAVSSIIASRVAPPGCALPALNDEKVSACLNTFPARTSETAGEAPARTAAVEPIDKPFRAAAR